MIMGGYSGTRVAPHTRLAMRGGQTFAISTAQHKLLRLALHTGGDIILTKRELRSAELLACLNLGKIWIRGSGVGKHDVFRVAEGVTVRP
jgi:hypothetical protein